MTWKHLGKIDIQTVIKRADVLGTLDAVILQKLKTPPGSLTSEQAQRLDGWIEENMQPSAQDNSWERQRDLDNASIDKQSEILRKQRQQVEQANAVLLWYQQNQGLLDTPRNAERIKAHVEKFSQGIWCRAAVESAVEGERKNLEWRKVEVAPPPAPATPNRDNLLWQPGMPLPDAATPEMLRQADVAALKDWTRRQQAKSAPAPAFRIASKF